jgi:hypothetical protein
MMIVPRWRFAFSAALPIPFLSIERIWFDSFEDEPAMTGLSGASKLLSPSLTWLLVRQDHEATVLNA